MPGLDFMRRQPDLTQLQATHRLGLLRDRGHDLRRPYCDHLGGGLWELRWHTGRVQYRILYFFHGQRAVILAHAITKEGAIPAADLARAARRKAKFYADPDSPTRTRTLEASMPKTNLVPRTRGTTDAVKIFHALFVRTPRQHRLLEEERQRVALAELIRELREAQHMTQAQLASKVGTTQSAIARIEDAKYTGHKLGTIAKVAAALGHQVEVNLVKV